MTNAIERGFVERPGCRIFYETTGSGPAIIFLHGLGSNHLTWWQQISHFQNRYRCITVSHRGYAPSSATPEGPDPKEFPGDLAALIAHLRLEDVRLVAQSMGGWASLEYALAHPDKVRALVLASTCGTIQKSSVPLSDPHQLDAWERNAAMARKSMLSRGISTAGGERMAREQPALHALYQTIAGINHDLDREALRSRIVAVARRHAEILKQLATPTLFITGGEDTTYAPFLSKPLAAMMKNAAAEQVPDAGHSVYFERAEIFNRLVERFLIRRW